MTSATTPTPPEHEPALDSAPGDRRPGEDLHKRQEQLIDEALEETFPASDPIAPKDIS